MASWKEERDRLVAQSLAFVQQVASAHPGATPSRPSSQATVIHAATSGATATAPAPAPSDPAPDAMTPIAVAATNVALPAASIPELGPAVTSIPVTTLLTAKMLANHGLYAGASERADIMQRVAAFKARQNQIGREREAYYDAVQAGIRTKLGNVSSSDRL